MLLPIANLAGIYSRVKHACAVVAQIAAPGLMYTVQSWTVINNKAVYTAHMHTLPA